MSSTDTISNTARRLAAAAILAGLAAIGLLVATARPAEASTSQWSFFEDHTALVRSPSLDARTATLNEIKALGADTLRVEVKWNEVAPDPDARTRPGFEATDPSAYPGFFPYDDLITKATAMGFRS